MKKNTSEYMKDHIIELRLNGIRTHDLCDTGAVLYQLREGDTVTIFSMSLEISKTYIDHWKLYNNGFILSSSTRQ